MKQIDQQYLITPFYGSRRMSVWLDRRGCRAAASDYARNVRDVTCLTWLGPRELRRTGAPSSVAKAGSRPSLLSKLRTRG